MMDTADRLRGIAFELEYWRAAIDDLGSMNDGVMQAAGSLGDATVALLTIATCPDEARQGFVLDAMDAIRSGLGQLHAMQTPIGRMIDLAEGRARVLSVAIEAAKGEGS